ncbi:Regulatory protein AtoC [wastewater metagenome]|uniref:Regulatory protein AtoC n=2 Tax=unclassified sequences TaxID=12908 RepID=A0A5B8RF97_9ZZZZ|nr:sigma-54 dependent transcriptional regulator [Arhodomonas sp. KWT]QEA06673.1 regulatory protein AtoC [uncultured organism]
MSRANRILVADDEAKMRRLLEMALRGQGHEVATARDGREALAQLEADAFDLVLTDLKMPHVGGVELLRRLRELGQDVPVIVLTAYGTVETAVEAMKLGAVDYIIRPFEMATVEIAVTRALDTERVRLQNRYLRDEAERGRGEFIGRSAAMDRLYTLLHRVAPTRSGVMIVGETGTGKELVARAIHRESGRDGLFVAINCAAIPDDLLESELFGVRKGAYTGADRDRTGRFELASGGTLFLDEITETPIALQTKLLRVLQEGTVERLGSQHPTPVDLRVVAATNRNPQAAVSEGRLREDLYYRLNVVRVDVPPLRERGDDIALLAEHFLHRYCAEIGRRAPAISEQAVRRLREYGWPGNVRELQNLMERAAVLCPGDVVDVAELPAELTGPQARHDLGESALRDDGDDLALPHHVEALERTLIDRALRRAHGNKAAAARALEISERSLWYRIKKYGL